ncbi:tRNA lysidine(34) synthetase TilS [Cellulosilyticum sp. I15G10I2]|uniref:tRNA lysidine(34) synthetase TilS n=1 Tax=Cellulosilyticum sp. I15G10I2 TaxID=1892843 RepID=UPI00085BDF7D|nr:tRNA lysidine(34) synthetase TilS [Cellulosilyticum sp. I15G10I2]
MLKAIENKVRNFIRKYNLIQNGDNLVVGVSGGADSMMLLHFLHRYQSYYNIQIKVAHIHHGIRDEAERDALFVEEICKKWELPYYRHNCNIKQLARAHGISEEEAGRIERYNFFISLSNHCSKIVTAHNKNDQAETLIMRFLRGTDINGLGGIPPQRDNIIRPLLCLKRTEIEAYCLYHGISYKDDHTNFMTIYTRNKVRLECIPYIEQNINPNIVNLLGEHSELYREGEAFLKMHTHGLFEKCAVKSKGNISINLTQFQEYHKYVQRRVILLALEALNTIVKDITLKHLESIIGLCDLQSGKKICLPHNIVAYKEYEELIIGYKESEDVSYRYPLDLGIKEVPEARGTVILTVVKKESINQKNEKMYTKYIDYGKIKAGLEMRTRLPHDYIATKEGTKKLKKFFIDDKVPKTQRDSIPLIADGEEIIWIIGSRLSANYYVTEATKQVLEIKIIFN